MKSQKVLRKGFRDAKFWDRKKTAVGMGKKRGGTNLIHPRAKRDGPLFWGGGWQAKALDCKNGTG